MSISQAAFGRDPATVACCFLVTYYREFTKEGDPSAITEMYSENSYLSYAEYNEVTPLVLRGRAEIGQHIEKMDANLSRRKVEVRFADYNPLPSGSVHIVTQGIMYIRGMRRVFTQSFILSPTVNRTNVYHIISEYFRVLHVEMERIPEGSILMTPIQVAQHLLEEQERRKRKEEERERLPLFQQQQQLLHCVVQDVPKQPEECRPATVEGQNEQWDRAPYVQERRGGMGEFKNRTPAGERNDGGQKRKERVEWETEKLIESRTDERAHNNAEGNHDNTPRKQPNKGDSHRRPDRIKRDGANSRAGRVDAAEAGRPERRERRGGEGEFSRENRKERREYNEERATNTRVAEGDAVSHHETDKGDYETTRRPPTNSQRRDRHRHHEKQAKHEPSEGATDPAAGDPEPNNASGRKEENSKDGHKPLPRSEAPRGTHDMSRERRTSRRGERIHQDGDNNNNNKSRDDVTKAVAAGDAAHVGEQQRRFPRRRFPGGGVGAGPRLRTGPTDRVRLVGVPKGFDDKVNLAIKSVVGDELEGTRQFGSRADLLCTLRSEAAAARLMEKPLNVDGLDIRVVPFYP